MDKEALFSWFERYGRHDLPWRRSDDPYHILVSEIMLQQTQVERVLKFYEPFLQKFPSLQCLARASEEEVLAAWSGLGYYKRARMLHKLAQTTIVLPTSYEELLKLPGIGTYTASALMAFAYNKPYLPKDTNIKRLLMRYFGGKIEEIKEDKNPRDFALALMDLGAMVCGAKEARCEICPLQKSCLGRDDPLKFTQPKKVSYEKRELHFGVYLKDGKVGLVPASGSMYQGLWELPRIKPHSKPFATFHHSYTKYRLKVHLYWKELEAKKWIGLDEDAPIAALTKKALKIINIYQEKRPFLSLQ